MDSRLRGNDDFWTSFVISESRWLAYLQEALTLIKNGISAVCR